MKHLSFSLGEKKININNNLVSHQLKILKQDFIQCELSYLAMNASEAGVDLALMQTSQPLANL